MKRFFSLFICVCIFLGGAGCDAQAISELIHTATPTITSTPLPTNTPVPTKTPQPTATVYFIPTAVPDSQISMELLENHNWLVIDHEAGYQYEISDQWYLDDVSSMEVMDIVLSTEGFKEKLGLTMPPQMFIEPEGMRILGVYRDDSITDYMSMAFNSTHITDEIVSADTLEDFAAITLNVLANTYGYTEDDFGIAMAENENGLPVITVVFNLALNYYQVKILFELENGFGMITYGLSDQNIDEVQYDLDKVIDSLQLIGDEPGEEGQS
jgi:hypothetical protein